MTLSEGGFTALIPILEVAPAQLDGLKTFDSGSASLDGFLRENALDLQNDHLAYTSLIFHENFDGIVGYITLTNDAVRLKRLEIGELGLNFNTELDTFPAIKICRLAVSKQVQSQNIGGKILESAAGEIFDLQPISSARLLITDAINSPKVIDFYERNGFSESIWATDIAKNNSRGKERATIKMIKDLYAL